MASARRLELTPVSLHCAVGCGLPHTAGLNAPPAPPCQAERSPSGRIELVLFEPDEARCAEFHYPELTAGEAPKQRKDRVQDLVDMGYGYDDSDSFIDNSEAYDELVPACLTTRHGGFYINVGTLQFRQVSGEEHESDDFEEKANPKKRKLKEGGSEVRTNSKKKKKRKEEVQPKGDATKPSRGAPSVDKKKVRKQQQDLDRILKFHKEKLQELRLFNTKTKLSPPAAEQVESTTDPSSLLVDASGSDDLRRAVTEQGVFSTNNQNQEKRETEDDMFQASPPDGLPPALEQSLQDLTQDDQLAILIRSLEEAVVRVIPEQIKHFNNHCQVHAEARAAKLEAAKEKRAAEGSDEEEIDSIGKRVFGPRKRFRWNEELRELLCKVVQLKMGSFKLDAPADQSLQEYLKSFLEASVKTVWPRGWMQSRILLIESRRIHAHLTGVVARKKPMMVPKPGKGRCGAGICPGNSQKKFEGNMDVPVNRAHSGALKAPSTHGGVSDPELLPAEVTKCPVASSVERDLYCPPSLVCMVAATEGSCGDPALPTPSLSYCTSSPRSAPESGTLSIAPLLASPFIAFPHDAKHCFSS